jgi:hypothetical protein
VRAEWFPILDGDDDDDWLDVGAMSPAEELFVATLRRYHADWAERYGWAFSSFLIRTDDGFPGSSEAEPVIAVLDLCRHTYGASFNGSRLRCDYVHNQLFYIDRPTSSLYLEADGEPERLAALAAMWFLTQVRGEGDAAH